MSWSSASHVLGLCQVKLIAPPYLILFICRSHLKARTMPEAYMAISYINSDFYVANLCPITIWVHLNAFQAAKAWICWQRLVSAYLKKQSFFTMIYIPEVREGKKRNWKGCAIAQNLLFMLISINSARSLSSQPSQRPASKRLQMCVVESSSPYPFWVSTQVSVPGCQKERVMIPSLMGNVETCILIMLYTTY